MAAAYYNHFTKTTDAQSAGTGVELAGETLLERRDREGGTVSIDAMAQDDIDIGNNQKTQLTPQMLDKFDMVLSMTAPEVTPSWLSSHKNYQHWDVSDPGAQDIAKVLMVRDEIKEKVQQFTRLQKPGATS